MASINLPEFNALPGEDVNEFLRNFEIATLILEDDTKCLALHKAMKGAAYIWFNNYLNEDGNMSS